MPEEETNYGYIKEQDNLLNKKKWNNVGVQTFICHTPNLAERKIFK